MNKQDTPLGTSRTDVLAQATEDLEAHVLVLWHRRYGYNVRLATKRRKGILAGVTTEWVAKGGRVWIRVHGPGSVKAVRT